MIYTIFRRRSYYAARAKRGSCKVFSRLKPKECTRNYTYLQFVMKHHTTNILFWRMCSLVCRTVHIKYTLQLMEHGEFINCLTSDSQWLDYQCALLVSLNRTNIGRQYMIPLSYFSFQPVLHDWCYKRRGMCYPVYEMVYIKDICLLIENSSPCGDNGFPLSLSEWPFIICPTPYNHIYKMCWMRR